MKISTSAFLARHTCRVSLSNWICHWLAAIPQNSNSIIQQKHVGLLLLLLLHTRLYVVQNNETKGKEASWRIGGFICKESAHVVIDQSLHTYNIDNVQFSLIIHRCSILYLAEQHSSVDLFTEQCRNSTARDKYNRGYIRARVDEFVQYFRVSQFIHLFVRSLLIII